jgi:tetratricopeptide (TPR) repeat protein
LQQLKVYISSTYEDLKEYRKAVYDSLRKLREDVIAMEDYVAQDQRPLQKCLEDVISSDIYIGIFAWRYGYIPNDNKENPNNLSITELEYRKAKEKGIPCLIFLLDKEEWPLRFSDGTSQSGIKGENINRLRTELQNNHIVSTFKNPDNLASLVVTAITQVIRERDQLSQQFSSFSSSSSPSQSSFLSNYQKISEVPLEFEDEKKIFVGRKDYINKIIKEKLQPIGSVVSIIGPGGSGKTQLAYKAIHQYIEEKIFDIVIPIYFSRGIPSFAFFLTRIAENLGLVINEFEKIDSQKKRESIIKNSLKKKKRPLLYFDNYETISFDLNKQSMNKNHKPSEDALQIEYFLNNLPQNTSILLTSRETNNRLSEIPIELQGLEKKESTELFIQLARSILRDNPTSTVESAIDSITAMTGGHPLSLELIARNIVSIYDIEEMKKEIKISKASINDPEKRLRTLNACFDYTVSKLDSILQEILQKITLFKSPFPIDASEEIFDAKKEDIINLYNRSLLTTIQSHDIYGKIEDPKYFLYKFHLVTRNYLENKIKESGNSDFEGKKREYSEKFANFYYHFANDTFNAIENEDEDRTDKISRFNIIIEVQDNDFERALSLTNNLSLKAELSTLLGSILNRLSIYNKALEYHRISEEINNRIDNRIGLARDYQNIGWLYSNMLDYEKALEYHEKSLQEYNRLNDKSGIARENSYIGLTLSRLNKHKEALEYHQKAITIDSNISNNERWVGEDYHNIATTLYRMEDYHKALEYYKMALERYAIIGDNLRMAYCHSGLGLTNESLGEHERALEHHYQAIEKRKNMEDMVGIAREYYNISFVFSNTGKKEDALKSLSNAKSILEEFEGRKGYRHPILIQVKERISYLENL